jgi:tRNA(Ile)-lysidine synthase
VTATTKPLTKSEARSLFAPLMRFPHLGIAVSGGSDSMALMHLLVEWRAARRRAPALSVLTVDHGLRPESLAEAEAVGRAAAALGLPHTILRWADATKTRSGLQAAARTARYNLMAQFCHGQDIPALITAHHLDDQAETFLMRLKRGSGLAGLAGIPAESVWAGIAVLRPLLEVPKARLVASLRARKIAWSEDPSNAAPEFERTRLRADRDAFAALGLSPEALARSARRLQRARLAIEASATAFLAAHSRTDAAGFSILDREALFDAPEEVALWALGRLIAAIGGMGEPPRLVKLEAVLAALKAHPEKGHTLGGCRLEPAGGEIGIFRETRRGGLPELALEPGEHALWDNRFRVRLEPDAEGPVVVRALGAPAWRDLKKASGAGGELPKGAGPTLVSCWRGDRLLCVPHLRLHEGGFDVDRPKFAARFVHAQLTSATRALASH